MGFLTDIWKKTASDFVFAPIVQAPDGSTQKSIPKESAYLSVILRSMRIVDVRRGWNKFYPVVHSYISLPHRGGQTAEFQVVTSPSRLAELDSNNLDNVINLNHRLLGPIPYRGGDLNVEVGLFSVKFGDLAKPFLTLMETMASAAGVSYVSVARPFIDPLKKGLELLTGSTDLGLEIGLANTFSEPMTGYFFVMRADRGTVDPSQLRIAEDFRLVDKKGSVVANYPYFVFSISVSDERDDWFMIPEIAGIYAAVRDAVRRNKQSEVEEEFAAFKRTVLTSPDLLGKDAQRLIKLLEEELTLAIPTSKTAARSRDIRPLRELPLYKGI